MATSFNTVADVASVNGVKLSAYMSSDVLENAPVVKAMYAILASQKDSHKWIAQSATAGAAFRAGATGLAAAVSSQNVKSATCSILDASFNVDQAILAMAMDPAAYLGRELERKLKSAFHEMEKQIVLGTGADGSEFAGLNDSVDSSMVIDANSSDTDGLSHIFMVRTAPDGVALALGDMGKINVSEPFKSVVYDGDGKSYDAQRVTALGLVTLQLGGKYDIGKVLDCGYDNYGDIDQYLGALLAKFENGEPNLIIMSRTVREALRLSYTSTTGAPVGLLTNWQGIPIVCSDSCGALAVAEISA